MAKKRVLFICNHNAGRSQMAEALLRSMYGDTYDAMSAGSTPAREVNPYVVRALAEIGIDATGQKPKLLDRFRGQTFDYVATVCGAEGCPFFAGGREYIHQEFDDPAALAGTEEEIMKNVRRVRDEIKSWIEKTFG